MNSLFWNVYPEQLKMNVQNIIKKPKKYAGKRARKDARPIINI